LAQPLVNQDVCVCVLLACREHYDNYKANVDHLDAAALSSRAFYLLLLDKYSHYHQHATAAAPDANALYYILQ
jgi:hypothetical protein